MARVLRAWAINRRGKNSVHNFQYGPHNFSLQNKGESLRVQLVRADIIHSQREIEVLFSILIKLTFSIFSEHKTVYKCRGSYSLRRCEKSAREPRDRHSRHLIRQRDNIHARATDICVDPRGYMTSGYKKRKIAPNHGCGRIPRLTVFIPDYGS